MKELDKIRKPRGLKLKHYSSFFSAQLCSLRRPRQQAITAGSRKDEPMDVHHPHQCTLINEDER